VSVARLGAEIRGKFVRWVREQGKEHSDQPRLRRDAARWLKATVADENPNRVVTDATIDFELERAKALLFQAHLAEMANAAQAELVRMIQGAKHDLHSLLVLRNAFKPTDERDAVFRLIQQTYAALMRYQSAYAVKLPPLTCCMETVRAPGFEERSRNDYREFSLEVAAMRDSIVVRRGAPPKNEGDSRIVAALVEGGASKPEAEAAIGFSPGSLSRRSRRRRRVIRERT
jgi:hypothetical protein